MITVNHLAIRLGDFSLANISFEVPEGQYGILMGHTGCGKTTILEAVCGLRPVAGGSITLAGRNVTHAKPALRGIGYVPQGRDIFPHLTVQENLEVSLSISGKAGKERLEEVYELFPVIKEMLGRKGGVLSGGQQQQLAIGRAILTNPKLLIFDEPTEGIQPSIIDQIEDAIHLLKKQGNLSIILVEQYLDFAKAACDEFYILDRGSVVLEGESEELTGEVIEKYLTV